MEEYFSKLKSVASAYLSEADVSTLFKAYRLAQQYLEGHVRANGESLLEHSIQTALIAMKLQLDMPSIATALVYQARNKSNLETIIEEADLSRAVGDDVVQIVEGTVALSKFEFDTRKENQAESFRMMLFALAKDVRSVLVKLCERLHTMRTLDNCSPEQVKKISDETLEIYATLANRLGIHWMKSELEDLCLKHLRPEVYSSIHESFGKTNEERSNFIKHTADQISELLDKSGVSATVLGRVKHYYSVWKKMRDKNLRFDQIHDILGFRVVVPSVRACYETLGIIHSAWKPVPSRFKDYIAMPKPNMYQSLHTTVIGPEGDQIEVQIRTHEMNKIAEQGIAAHWKYKEGLESGFDLKWITELLESKQYIKNPEEFVQSVRSDVFPEQVMVFTPKGDIVRLPYGSTPIDFSYAIHTDIGHATTGAVVNGQICTLDYTLENGDTLHIITGNVARPSKDWLKMCRTSKAKQRIRAFVRLQERKHAITKALELIQAELKDKKLSFKKLSKSDEFIERTKVLGFKNIDDCLAAVGYGTIQLSKLFPKKILNPTKIVANTHSQEFSHPGATDKSNSHFSKVAQKTRAQAGVSVSGVEDIVISYAKCCEPLPGDPIVGFISRGRGVTIHHKECASLLLVDNLRILEASWDKQVSPERVITITVFSQDQTGLLAKMTDVISKHSADVRAAHCTTSKFGKVHNMFELKVRDVTQVNSLIRSLEMVPGVTRVERSHHSIEKIIAEDIA
jgi:GTP diphosphokinase / guanosine-3',5'-bis(diphosphate) 3'-diphosphatase